MKNYSFPILALLFYLPLKAQLIPVDDNLPARQYPYVSTAFNRIFNSGGLDSFYQKLLTLKKTGKGVVSIVHIGDSHIQAGFLTALVRDNLQQFFGNAGRGLVFPYQLAQSNAPPDISSSSNTAWQFNRLAHPEIPVVAGISGFTIRSNTMGASLDLSLRPNEKGEQLFNRMKLFLDSSSSSSWILQANPNDNPYLVTRNEKDTGWYREVLLEKSSGSFSLASLPSPDAREFYGVSLENSDPGILYHSIGVNGARYDHYNNALLFWQQLAALKADLFIISLGTNESQRTEFNEKEFQQQLSLFLQNLQHYSPGASLLITTAADSYYKKRRSNAVLRQLNISLYNYCIRQHLPIWDLYRITNGYGSAYHWMKRGLMNADRIHFTGEGYRIQGQLLFNALGKGYNNYVNSY